MPESEMLVKNLAEKHGRGRNSLMPILQGIVKQKSYISETAMLAVAKELNISTADVYGTASFYTFLDTVPRGKNIIRVCKTITCQMKGKEEIILALEKTLNIKLGETTHDKQFSLLATNCLGWCHQGPAMLINDNVYTELTTQKAIEIVEEFIKAQKNA